MLDTRALYHRLYRFARWSLRSSGPLAPVLNRLRRRVREQSWFRQRVPNLVNPLLVGGLSIYHDGAADPTIQALAMDAYEPETVRLFTGLIQPGMTVLDVGAHIGYFTLLAARGVGEMGRVYSFEPLPANNTLLRRNVTENSFSARVTIIDQAVTDRPDQLLLHDSGHDAGTATLFSQGGTTFNVRTTSLDAWAAEQGWPRVDFIKMDIEGAEVAALNGMHELKRRNPRLELICEFNPTTLGYAALEPAALPQALLSCGFTEISIIGSTLRPLSLPDEIPYVIREAHRWDLVNLLCR
jgi:FkbM family methyltransferase